MPHLERITIFPIKSLDGFAVETAELLSSGALCSDRRFAIVDEHGKFVNGKRDARVHTLRATFQLSVPTVHLSTTSAEATFDLRPGNSQLDKWLSDYFAFPVRIEETLVNGFPDDLGAPGPTIISTATLATVANWFPELTLDEVRRRFRANLEVGETAPFWEDRLYSEKENVGFQIGEVALEGTSPCQRCVVPTRDSATSEVTPSFAHIFSERRRQSLPEWAARSRFNHFYRLAVNSKPINGFRGGRISVGDTVKQ